MAILSMDSKFMKFMDQFVDLVMLNLLWLVFSLPLVTVGAATAAASSLILKDQEGDPVPLIRGFWREFRRNFRRGTLLWLVQAAGLIALALDFQLLGQNSDPPLVLLIFSFVLAALLFLGFLYAYPLTARYDSPLVRTVLNSLNLTFRYWGRTLLVAFLLLLELALFTWNTTMLFFGLVIGPMVLLSTIAGIARGVFRDAEAHPTSR